MIETGILIRNSIWHALPSCVFFNFDSCTEYNNTGPLTTNSLGWIQLTADWLQTKLCMDRATTY